MAKKFLGLIIALMVFGGCASAPLRPAVNQTVVSVSRHSATGEFATGQMEVYIDSRVAQTLEKKPKDIKLRAGQSISIPVNNGVHTIYVQIGNTQSEAFNFTASGPTLAFVATVEGIGPLRKITLARSIIDDDTGSLTDREIQASF
jgi:hypothetical protein